MCPFSYISLFQPLLPPTTTTLQKALLRRGPAWLINELISVFPGSPTLPTDLGEYPLHLTVDKACMPEVINLIIVANWSAIVATDHLGRTPIDILDNQELLEIEENQVIFESLKRGLDTYTEIQRVHNEEKASLIRKQKAKSNAVSKLHQEELKKEQAKQVKLELEIANYKAEIKNVREGQDETENKIQKHILSQNKCLDTIHELTEKETLQRQQLEAQRAQIKALLFRVEQQDSEIQIKNHKIEVLSKDLKGIALANETFVKESLIETEQSMRTMVSNQIALQKLLTSRSNGLKTVLKHRGIALPDIRQLESLEDDQVEEEKSFEEDDLDDFSNHDVAASAAMMAAATAAIKAASTDEW